MSQPEQNFQNHAKFDPFYHFFLAPLSILLMLWALWHGFRERSSDATLIALGMVVLFLLVLKVRIYALKVQDRVIRLEERLRLGALGGDALRTRLPELTEGQLIALRFASDGEVPELAARALDEKMKPKEIKAAVVNWRGDYFRI